MNNFNSVLDSLCRTIKPLLVDKISEIEFFLFFYHDTIENVLYFKGMDKQFNVFLKDNKLQNVYGENIGISKGQEEGTIGRLFGKINDNLGRYQNTIYYYPDINRDPKSKKNIEYEKCILKRFGNKEYYSSLLIPLIIGRQPKKRIVGIACIVLKNELLIQKSLEKSNKVKIEQFEQLDDGEKSTLNVKLYERLISVFKEASNIFKPIIDKNKETESYAIDTLYKLLVELRKGTRYQNELTSITRTLRESTREGESLRAEVTKFIENKTSMKKVVKDFKDYEEILMKSKNYRDHFIHMFRVYIEGLFIIAHLINKDLWKQKKSVMKKWSHISLVHDFGYPVQLFQKWSDNFFAVFNEKVKGKDIEINFSLENILINKEYASYLEELSIKLCDLCRIDKKFTRKIIFSALLDKGWQDHGIISALMYLNQHKKSFDSDHKETMDIASAMAFHNFSPWKYFLIKNEKIWNKLNIRYEKSNLTFLLAYIDAIQEYGRPDSSKMLSKTISSANNNKYEIFEEVEVIDNKVIAKLTFFDNKVPIPFYNIISGDNKTEVHKKVYEIIRFINSFESKTVHFEFVFTNVKLFMTATEILPVAFCTNKGCTDAPFNNNSSSIKYFKNNPLLQEIYEYYNDKSGNSILNKIA